MHINDDGDEPVLLPMDWDYNNTHVALMDEKLPGYDHDRVAAVFALESDGLHSADWNKEFTRWIQRVANSENAKVAFNATMETFVGIDPPAGFEAA